ncbi:MAG: transposase [Candidatus Omnitrophota bacterium]
MISLLYKIEAEIKHLPPDEKKARPIIENKIKPWLEAGLTAHLPQSEMRKAIGYSLGIWKELQTYLLDGRIPIDNNLAENAIRPIALDRKNKINTWAYLKDVLQRINAHPSKRLHELLPDRWQSNKS